MQSVNSKIYTAYRWAVVGASTLLLIFAAISWWAKGILPFEPLSISYISAGLAAGVLAFAVLYYGRLAAKTTDWEAALLLVMFQATAIFSLMQTTGQMTSPFTIWWGLMAFLAGMFGIYGSAGCAFLSVMYFIVTATETDGGVHYELSSTVALIGLMTASLIGQFFWKRYYINADNERVASLSGQLKASQKQSEILVQSLTDGVVLMDTAGTVTLMNPAAATMTGWSVEDGTGTDSKLVVIFKNEDGSDLEPQDNPVATVLNQTQANTSVLQLNSRDGNQIIASVVTSPIINPKTQETMGGMVVIRDISVSHQSDKQRAEFISTASHEMRTPVAAIEGYLQLALNEKVSKVDPKARDFLTKALDSTHHLGELFQDLLTSAKAEDGRLVSHPEVIELGEYIEQLTDSFKFSAEKKGLLTDFIFGRSSSDSEHVVRPLYYVLADPDRLREVVTNLFDNAVKYTPNGKISLGLTGNNEVVQIFVRDTGPGIAPEDITHLFQKFYRVDNSATRTIGGTGLGLFICKKIIEMYKGRIWAESEINKGSTFYINLPRLSSQQAQELKTSAAQSTVPAPINSLTTPV